MNSNVYDMLVGMDRIAYPRTPHLPESLGAGKDDSHAKKPTLDNLASGIELIVTEKMDGGNVTLYNDFFHARSVDATSLPWETMAKNVWSVKRFLIPDGWRVSCESMFAQRSVPYDTLPAPLFVIGVWDENNNFLSWDDVNSFAEELELPVVPFLYRGNDFVEAKKAWGKVLNDEISEGFVVRNAGSFSYDTFGLNVAKFVRKNHVRTPDDFRRRDDFKRNTFERIY